MAFTVVVAAVALGLVVVVLHQRRTLAALDGTAVRGQPGRHPDRAAQPARLRGDAQLRARPLAAHRPPRVGHRRRDRRDGAAQRRAGAQRRGCGAQAGRPAHVEVEAPDRLGRAHRRGEVRRTAPRDRRARGVPGGRAAAPRFTPQLRPGSHAPDDLLRRRELPRARRGVRRADGRGGTRCRRGDRAWTRSLGGLLRRRRPHARRAARAGEQRTADVEHHRPRGGARRAGHRHHRPLPHRRPLRRADGA